MDRLFYSPTQYAKHLIEDNDAVGSDAIITEINYLISFDHIHQNTDYDNYYVRPIAIKCIGINQPDEERDVLINITKSQYSRMKMYHDKDPDGYICLRTDTRTMKTFNSIDGDHQYYQSKILLVPTTSKLHQQLDELVAEKAAENANRVDCIEENFTL